MGPFLIDILSEFDPLCIDYVGQLTYNLVPRLLDQEELYLYTCGDIHKDLDLDPNVIFICL